MQRPWKLPLTILALVLALIAYVSYESALAATSAADPVYVHMNAANDFLESVVAVHPGQPVVFVNQDTDAHTIVGYDPSTGKQPVAIDGKANGTQGAGHGVGTFTVRLTKPGIYPYYCSVHARLSKTFGSAVQPAPRKGADGYGGAMAGVIIVTDDASLLAQNPKTSARKVLPNFFGG